MSRTRRLSPCLLALLLLGAAGPALAADEMPVPAKFQAVLFKRIFAYERVLKAEPQVRVLLAGTGNTEAARALQQEFEAVGIPAAQVPAAKVAAELGAGTVLFLFPDSPASLRELALKRKVLCISGFPALVLAGNASIGVDKKADGKPQILVHLPRLKAEGHELSADLLRLARVVP